MPPDHPFPQAPFDCLTVYKFLLEHLHRYVNIRPSEIYLTGDSAGGNLACVLTGLILKEKLLIPKGLYISYPATDMRFAFSTSRLYAITDPLLWPSMLLICLNSYLKGDISKANDPLASPLLLTEEYIGGVEGDKRFPLKWPKTVITVGNKDPLYDDSLMLMQKMVEVGVDCECIVYD
jgi:acetyl esterase/lipase